MTGRRIAVVGGGVSGITAGYVLAQADHVTLFEADDRLGGHADTHPTGVDTGFIVYNERTYPLLTGCSPNSGVATQPSADEHVGPLRGCGLQYAGQRGLRRPGRRAAPGPRPATCACSPRCPRFHRPPARLLDHGDPDGQTSPIFSERAGSLATSPRISLLPLVAAVWSCPPDGAALSGPVPVRVPGQPRDAVGVRVAAVADRDRRLPPLRGTGRQAAGRDPAVHAGPGGAPPPGSRGGPRRGRRDAPVRRRGHRHPRRPGAAPADRPTDAERDVLGAFTYTHNPARAAHRRLRAAAQPGARASWNYLHAAGASRTARRCTSATT